MTVKIGSELEQMIDAKVRSGQYASAEDVVRAGLLSLQQQEGVENLSTPELTAVFPDLRAKIAEGLLDEREGRMTDGETFFEELDRED